MTPRALGWVGATAGALVLVSGMALALGPGVTQSLSMDDGQRQGPAFATEISVLIAPALRSVDGDQRAEPSPMPEPSEAPKPEPLPAPVPLPALTKLPPPDVMANAPAPKQQAIPPLRPKQRPEAKAEPETPKAAAPKPETPKPAAHSPTHEVAGAPSPATRPLAAGGQSPAAYAKAVMKKVRATPKHSGAGKGKVVVGFAIGADGGLVMAKVITSSGNAQLDQVALDHIHRAAPFPAPPSTEAALFSFEFVGK